MMLSSVEDGNGTRWDNNGGSGGNKANGGNNGGPTRPNTGAFSDSIMPTNTVVDNYAFEVRS